MYLIEKYEKKHKEGVAKLLIDLWGNSPEENIKKFEYKYESNPYDKNIYAVVALHDKQVVGFRGFVPMKFSLKGNDVWFLLVADANVHSEHRRKGLFHRMTKEAIEIFQDTKFEGYLNLSSNQFSSPGYLKMGWKSICKKDYHRITNLKLLLLLKFGLKRKANNYSNVEIVNFDNIPESLNRKNSIEITNKKNLYAYKTLRHSYVCLKFLKNQSFNTYVTITEKSGRCTIVDFECNTSSELKEMIKYLRKNYFLVSIWNPSLAGFHLKKSVISYLLEKMEEKRHTYILFRPTSINPTDSDFIIRDMNVLDVCNWNFKQIFAE